MIKLAAGDQERIKEKVNFMSICSSCLIVVPFKLINSSHIILKTTTIL